MGWGKLRSWWALSALVLAVAGLTAVPEVVKAAHLPKPGWTVPVVLALAAVLLGVWKPLLTARSDALAARAKARAERQARADSTIRGLPTRKGRLPRVDEVTSRAVLNIHEAIPLPVDADDAGLSPELPEYVTRDIDADLRTYLNARSTTGGFALLVGPAAAGKTRTAYEAVRHVLPHWRMLMPSTGAELNELVATGTDLTESVIWLNETQDFLTSSDPLTAATVRRLLTDTSRPVILIGTIWPDHYDQLRSSAARPSPPAPHSASAARPVADDTAPDSAGGGVSMTGTLADQQVEAPGRNEKDVLEQARVFSLPVSTEPEWERARELAARDPRLAHATANSQSGLGLTQILSAAPELILRWEQADNPYGKALISAAVTARRCGHPPTVPAPVLKALANHSLTGQQRADAQTDWFQQGLTWACQPVQHSHRISALSPHGGIPGQTDGHRVSDILTNHTGPTSPVPDADDVPAAVWDTLIEAADTRACFEIGRSAYAAGRRPQATTAWTRAAEADNAGAMGMLGFLAQEDGDRSQARTWYTRAAEADNAGAMLLLGILAQEDGDRETARTWYTRAAQADNQYAMRNLGLLAQEDGDRDQARTWYTRAAEADNAGAMLLLGILIDEDGDGDQARTWWTRAAEAGEAGAMGRLGDLADEDGDGDQARTWWTRAAEAGDAGAMGPLGFLAREDGDRETARTWWTRAAETDDTASMFDLGLLIEEYGDGDQARTWSTLAAQADNTHAMLLLGILAQEDDDGD
jgi:TPR repeat protein